MEKFDSKQQNMVGDEDLDQISGGRNLFDIFTTEFRGSSPKPATLEMIPDPEEDGMDFGISTLEMRADPRKKREKQISGKIVQL